MAISLLTVRASGKRSVSVTFTSGGAGDAVTLASIAALLSSTANSEIKSLLSPTVAYADAAAMLAAFGAAGVSFSLLGPTGVEAIPGAGQFTGFPAGVYMLRIAMSSTVSA